MPDHDDPLPAPPAEDERAPARPVEIAQPVTAQPSETAVAVPDVLALDRVVPPAMLEPEMVEMGMQHLRERIPEFEQLSIEERRSMARAAYLDPEFVRVAVQVAGVWDRAPILLQRTPEAMRQDEDETRRWDGAIRSFSAILQGMQSANLKRKHRLGRDALKLYRVLGTLLDNPNPEHRFLLPYYEEMKRLYRKNLAKKEKKGKKDGAE